MAFGGFPPEAITFYRGLEADNSKAYWQANKAVYESAVKGPMDALLAEVGAEFGPFRVFRPYRDTRFSKDKAPYKTNIGAVGEGAGGAIHYVALSAEGLFAGSGYYVMAKDQLERFRAAVDDDVLGDEVAAITAALGRKGYSLEAHDELKGAPRGYPKDHPRVDLLRRKGLVAGRGWPVAGWLHTRRALGTVVAAWRDCEALDDWLDRHVGPSTLPPDPRDVR
jgi:uncharacterized protein (TIGR02453 family)